jgi:flagellar protein FliS
MKNAYEQYKKIDLSTAPQTKLVVMMYEGAIKFLENASNALDKKFGLEEAHNNISKAQDVISELASSLNKEAGDISERLDAIYSYMNRRLTEANISKKKEPITEVIKYLKELTLAWKEAEANLGKNNSNNQKAKKDSNDDNTITKLNISG